jgi:hypothetical protein
MKIEQNVSFCLCLATGVLQFPNVAVERRSYHPTPATKMPLEKIQKRKEQNSVTNNSDTLSC